MRTTEQQYFILNLIRGSITSGPMACINPKAVWLASLYVTARDAQELDLSQEPEARESNES